MGKKRVKKSAATRKASKQATTRGRRPRAPRRYRILALDGGGIRGVMTAYWLARLEKKLRAPCADHFDLVAGTSTGSILACAIAMRIPAEQIVTLYREKGRDIFTSGVERLWNRFGRTFTQGISAPKYDDHGLEQTLRHALRDTRFADLPPSPHLLITSYNVLTRQAVVFKSHKPDHAHIPLWEAAKASSSAPTCFPAHVTGVLGATAPLIDGGVVANNPAACAIAEAVRLNDDKPSGVPLRDFVVGSFGTGESTRPITVKQAREWGPIEWAIPVIHVLMDGNVDATGYIAKQLLTPGRYIRVNTLLDNAFDDMDDASKTNIDALLNLAINHLTNQGGDDQINNLAKLIK